MSDKGILSPDTRNASYRQVCSAISQAGRSGPHHRFVNDREEIRYGENLVARVVAERWLIRSCRTGRRSFSRISTTSADQARYLQVTTMAGVLRKLKPTLAPTGRVIRLRQLVGGALGELQCSRRMQRPRISVTGRQPSALTRHDETGRGVHPLAPQQQKTASKGQCLVVIVAAAALVRPSDPSTLD